MSFELRSQQLNPPRLPMLAWVIMGILRLVLLGSQQRLVLEDTVVVFVLIVAGDAQVTE
jgi:hypothetical protein